MKKTAYNFLFQSLFQVMKIILPLITIPIISKALGPEGIGIYNYTNSIAQYFVLFAGLGVGVYGNREIAIARENKDLLSFRFWELFGMSFFVSILSLISFLLLAFHSKDSFYLLLQAPIVLGAMFDISWFFMGIEDFKKTSLSSLFAQIISFFCIIYFVNGPDDLWLYILIQSGNIVITQAVMWLFVFENITFKRVNFKNMFFHFIPSLQFFIPKIAIILYTNLNKTLLGWLDSKDSVGFYTNSLIMNSILVTLVTTLDLVLLPKLSNLASKGSTVKIYDTIKKTVNLQLFFTIPMMFGIILISPKLVPWFFGDEFLILKTTIPLVSPLIVIMPLGLAVGRQYLVPMNKIKVYNLAVLIGALVSIVINLFFIPLIGLYGAIIATLSAELFVTLTRFTAFIIETKIKFDFTLIFKYVISSFVMFVVTYGLTFHLHPSIVTTLKQFLIGVIIYMIVNVILKSNILFQVLKNRSL
ncbi:flippase [Enterococcus casseliflavus]|uniref:oligosaccharide flippase family protein n=1 Tax=Enterococcus casseliflavus TaxID=37734 RepID=UPI001AD7A307|nr:oligosaccharide flippase family protein [Enterococcus casseliflavus]MBO6383962.1 flippase [Enterococcus casseliflavus]